MRFISLFSGFGLMDRGLERAGWQCIAQVEINPYARKVLEKHWPEVPRYADVTKFCRRIYDCEPEDEYGEVMCPRCGIEFGECECIGTDELLDTIGEFDAIVGGDPCQRDNNSRRAGGAEPEALGGEFIRIVDELRPRLVLRENPSVVRADAVWPWWRFRAELERLDYAVLPFRLRACCVGADHRRERLFLLGELQESDSPRLERHERTQLAGTDNGRYYPDAPRPVEWDATSRICGSADGVRNRRQRLEGLGNGITTWQGEFIGRMIMEAATPEQGLE